MLMEESEFVSHVMHKDIIFSGKRTSDEWFPLVMIKAQNIWKERKSFFRLTC